MRPGKLHRGEQVFVQIDKGGKEYAKGRIRKQWIFDYYTVEMPCDLFQYRDFDELVRTFKSTRLFKELPADGKVITLYSEDLGRLAKDHPGGYRG